MLCLKTCMWVTCYENSPMMLQVLLQLLMIWMSSGPLLKELHTTLVTAQSEMNNGKVLRVQWQHLYLPTF